jgi:hypothetical protein
VRVADVPAAPAAGGRGELFRAQRALLVLEQVGSPAARACLRRLAGGAPSARLTREARATLDRLQRRAALATQHP